MGLDMYLTREHYVKNWDHMKPEELHQVTVLKAGKPLETQFKVSYVKYEIAYWRKANAIHNWFVVNVQDGKDECQESYVSREQLQELLDICVKILAKAKLKDGMIDNASQIAELLPTAAGFFFGSTDYDEGYLADIRYTVDVLTKALAEKNDGDFNYRASW